VPARGAGDNADDARIDHLLGADKSRQRAPVVRDEQRLGGALERLIHCAALGKAAGHRFFDVTRFPGGCDQLRVLCMPPRRSGDINRIHLRIVDQPLRFVVPLWHPMTPGKILGFGRIAPHDRHQLAPSALLESRP
jgi:hypothetical protein